MNKVTGRTLESNMLYQGINQQRLKPAEQQYLASMLAHSQAPNLETMWALMDTAWFECGCNQEVMDERIVQFYSHPVWLLNGLFIEQHDESLSHRREFTDYIASLKPKRVADFGGGYGTLARMIGDRCPDTEVHIIEPHPHASAKLLAEKTPNVRYLSDFLGEYDVLIATDVFEHVSDPLALLENTATHLRLGGDYLIANCFWPVILCHVPSTFHFRWSWDSALKAMKLQPGKIVAYGRTYKRVGPVSSWAARGIERRSKYWFELIERMPSRVRGIVARLLITGLL